MNTSMIENAVNVNIITFQTLNVYNVLNIQNIKPSIVIFLFATIKCKHDAKGGMIGL